MKMNRLLRLVSLVGVLMCLFSTVALAQNVTIRGTILNDQNEPVIGATVVVLGQTNLGAMSDIDGKFTIADVPANATIRVSFVGMVTQEIPVGGKTDFTIILREDSELLDEVVVVGYGTQKKVNLTGSVASVDGKTLEARPVANVGQALQGAIPGLNLTVNNGGGALNSRMDLNIRGAGTISSGSKSSPLILIDGTEGDLFSLSPNDIENISVLKDASSSAIYGSRAAFGVILITTKSGREGRTSVSYNGNLRFSTATQIPEMMDAYEYARYFNTAAANKGEALPFSPERLEQIQAFMNGTSKPGEESGTWWKGYQQNEPWAMYGESWANTDWFAEMYRPNVPSHEHNLSLSGGTERINYYVSGSILDQNGIIRHGRDKFNRYNFSGKVTAKITDWFSVTYNNKWVREDYNRPSYMTGLFFHNIARRWPTNPLRDPHGHYVHGNEILQMEDGGKDINQKDQLYQQLAFEFRPLEGWLIRLEGNYNTTHNHNHSEVLPIYYHDHKGVATPAAWSGDYAAGASNINEAMWKNNYYNGRFFTEYQTLINDKHDLKLLAGLDMETNNYTELGASRKDLITPKIPTLNNTTNKNPNLKFKQEHWSTMGMFARVNYAYDSRYLAEFSLRRDGSSRFIGDKTWATFPSFSLGWNIANEAFFKPLQSSVNLLKLRGSWGTLGNTNIEALYPWFLSQPVSPQASEWLINGEKQNTSDVPGLVSPDLTWETVESWNVGVDFGMFNNRLQGNFDYFVRSTTNMVGPAPSKPSILGAKQPAINNSDMRSQGWEFEIKWRDQVGELNYGLRFTLSDDIQTVTRYYNPNGNLGDKLDGWYEGRRMGEIWGYETAGIAKTDAEMKAHLANNKPSWGSNWAAGDVMYVNKVDRKDANGKIIDKGEVNAGANTITDHGDLSIIGNSMPRYRYGINADLSWKGIDFSIFLQGVGKRDFWDASAYSIGANIGLWQSVGFKDHLDFFRPKEDTNFGANTDAFYPRPLFDQGEKNFRPQTRYLQNAAYLRIKNIQLGYTLPEKWSKSVGMNRARIYFSADNLVTFTRMNKIFDPEATGGDWGPGKIYPLSRTISFGLNLNF